MNKNTLTISTLLFAMILALLVIYCLRLDKHDAHLIELQNKINQLQNVDNLLNQKIEINIVGDKIHNKAIRELMGDDWDSWMKQQMGIEPDIDVSEVDEVIK